MGRDIHNRPWIARNTQKLFAAAKFLALQFVGNVEHIPALWNLHADDIDLTHCDFPEDLPFSHRTLEEIFSRLQSTPMMPMTVEFKRNTAANHAVFCEQAGDAPAPHAMRNIHDHRISLIASVWNAEILVKPCCECPDGGNSEK